MRSHPSWVRGLKHLGSGLIGQKYGRTPRGCVDWNYFIHCVWFIQTGRTPRGCVDWNQSSSGTSATNACRTPRGCVDWNIEKFGDKKASIGRTPRGCVDWNLYSVLSGELFTVAPLVGAWIETDICRCCSQGHQSHPSWVRGLKHRFFEDGHLGCLSHPSWVRGLKQYSNVILQTAERCRTPRGCVDWNRLILNVVLSSPSRTPRGCVDWNSCWFLWVCSWGSRTPRGCVDWNIR